LIHCVSSAEFVTSTKSVCMRFRDTSQVLPSRPNKSLIRRCARAEAGRDVENGPTMNRYPVLRRFSISLPWSRCS
jgi:hypothetical protein